MNKLVIVAAAALALFSTAANAQAVRLATEGAYAPYNFMPAFTDTFIPLWLLGLLYAYWRCGGFGDTLRPERP